jgi:hypothetical protein
VWSYCKPWSDSLVQTTAVCSRHAVNISNQGLLFISLTESEQADSTSDAFGSRAPKPGTLLHLQATLAWDEAYADCAMIGWIPPGASRAAASQSICATRDISWSRYGSRILRTRIGHNNRGRERVFGSDSFPRRRSGKKVLTNSRELARNNGCVGKRVP